MATVRELITGSLRLLNVIQANESPTAQDMDISMSAMNAMLDSWSTDRLSIFLAKQYYFPLVANKKEYTLGAGGDWDIPRPMNIEKITVSLNASLTLSGGVYSLVNNPNVFDIPTEGLTDAQYAAVPVKNQTAPYPLKWYDNGNYPLRTVSMWPVPSTDQPITVWVWLPLTDPATLDTELPFPKGYERAIRFNLAVELASEFGKEVPATVAEIAASSYAALKRLNSKNQIMRGDVAISGGPGVYNWNLSTTIPN